MNTKQAKEIVGKRPGYEQLMCDPDSDCELLQAKGYLEGVEKGEGVIPISILVETIFQGQQ